MDLDSYFKGSQTHGLFRRGKRILPIMSTRGCPSDCTFCCRVMGRRVRLRSVGSVMAEIGQLVKTYEVNEIYFEDDNFTVKRDRALEILDRIAAISPRLFVKFANGIRADGVDRELLETMKKAGVYSLSFGIESGCPTTVARMRKHLDLGKAHDNVMLAKSMGFLVGANCIIGYPGETPEDVRESLDFLFGLPLHNMAIVNLVPFPGTEVREICQKEGFLTGAALDWDNYVFRINDPIVLIETPQLPASVLVRLICQAYKRMYLDPRRLRRTIRHVTFRELWRGAAIMFGVKWGRSGMTSEP